MYIIDAFWVVHDIVDMLYELNLIDSRVHRLYETCIVLRRQLT